MIEFKKKHSAPGGRLITFFPRKKLSIQDQYSRRDDVLYFVNTKTKFSDTIRYLYLSCTGISKKKLISHPHLIEFFLERVRQQLLFSLYLKSQIFLFLLQFHQAFHHLPFHSFVSPSRREKQRQKTQKCFCSGLRDRHHGEETKSLTHEHRLSSLKK